MKKRNKWVVYWLFDESCVFAERHGYIGATNQLWRRMYQHRQRGKWPDFKMRIICRGSKRWILWLENFLRPKPGIGWNIGIGGFVDGRGRRGIPLSQEHRERISAAALKRYADPAEHKRTSRAVKRSLKGVDRSGRRNSRFGKHCSEGTKEKMRQRIAERGISGSNNPNYKHGRYC